MMFYDARVWAQDYCMDDFVGDLQETQIFSL